MTTTPTTSPTTGQITPTRVRSSRALLGSAAASTVASTVALATGGASRSDSPEVARTPRSSMTRRALTLLVMLLSLTGLLSVTATTEASAAPASHPTTALVCFTQQGGGAFTNQVAAEYYINGRWNRVTYVNLPTSGCEYVAVAPGYYVRFAVTQRGFWGATSYQYIYSGYPHRFYGVARLWA